MPPKADQAVVLKGAKDEAFLIACIKKAKSKLIPDFQAVADLTGLSSGGARNKFALIMKQFEAEGALWTQNAGDAAPKKAPAAKRSRLAATKKKATNVETKVEEADPENGDDDEDEDEEDAQPPTKKAATEKAVQATKSSKARPKAAAAAVKSENSTDDNDSNNDDEANGSAPKNRPNTTKTRAPAKAKPAAKKGTAKKVVTAKSPGDEDAYVKNEEFGEIIDKDEDEDGDQEV